MLRKALYTQVKYIKTKHENLIAILSSSIAKTSMIFLVPCTVNMYRQGVGIE